MTTSTQSLASWLLERITEDERDARQALTSTVWEYDDQTGVLSTGSDVDEWHTDSEHAFRCTDDGDDCHLYRWAALIDAQHMVRWQPQRVLAECESKRRIVELHQWMGPVMAGAPVDDPKWCITCADHTVSGSPPLDWPCLTLRLLAVPYADRPGYREEWKP